MSRRNCTRSDPCMSRKIHRAAQWRRGPLLILMTLLMVIGLMPMQVRAQGRPAIVWMRGGHTDWVRSVAFSPDGTALASGSGNSGVRHCLSA
jgi:WD40 repeat protein